MGRRSGGAKERIPRASERTLAPGRCVVQRRSRSSPPRPTSAGFAYTAVKNAPKAIEFQKAAFGAVEKFRLVEPNGRVGHAELDFGGTILMFSDEYPELGIRGPDGLAATPVSIHLHVDDADEVIARAVAAARKW